MSINDLPAGLPAGVFRFGEFQLDCRLRQLLHNGEPRHLSPKAQQLLHRLLAAWPHALSREALYDALWPSTFVCETNLASVVNEVRRALDDNARTPQYIRTVHGFGYAFCGEVARSAPTPARAILLCEGRSYRLSKGENVVGRALDCDVPLMHPAISRRHAVITIANGLATIKDFDSTNGSYIDGRRIGSIPVIVESQAVIVLGGLAMSIIDGNPASTSPFPLYEHHREAAAHAQGT